MLTTYTIYMIHKYMQRTGAKYMDYFIVAYYLISVSLKNIEFFHVFQLNLSHQMGL